MYLGLSWFWTSPGPVTGPLPGLDYLCTWTWASPMTEIHFTTTSRLPLGLSWALTYTVP